MASASFIGWIDFSERELREARRLLQSESDGVRDELGLLAIHSGYADRFFPGTSVLQTRLRYVMFVPWTYQRLAQRGDRKGIEGQMAQEESALARALVKRCGKGHGVIGEMLIGRGRAAAQPPSFIYWTALREWGILRQHLSRSAFHRQFDKLHANAERVLRDDEQKAAERSVIIWHPDLPAAPASFPDGVDFELTEQEVLFLRRRILKLAMVPGRPLRCLLQRLVEESLSPGPKDFWSHPDVLAVAGKEEREVLWRAGQAAGLVAVVRSLYNALVEKQRLADGGEGGGHLAHLAETLHQYSGDIRGLDLDAMRADGVRGDRALHPFLVDIRAEILRVRRAEDLLADSVLRKVARKEARKDTRARLGTWPVHAANRRIWQPAGAGPVDYRWSKVHRILADLMGR